MVIQEGSELVVRQHEGLTMVASPGEALRRLDELKAFVQQVMVPDVDYGRIPGTDKDTLYQPGAQKLCEIYGFAQEFIDVRTIEDWDKPLFFYEVKCRLISRRDGGFIGEGVGSCNSKESRYAGRWVFDNEVPKGIDLSTLPKREGKSKKNGRPYTQYFWNNDKVFDQVNTMKKMACKRALVHAVIGATRSAGMFTQDMEDQQHAPPADPEPTGPNEVQQQTHHELRMVLTAAASWAQLDDAKELMGGAWKTGRLTKEQMDDLVAYGKKRRGELRPPPESDTNGAAP